MKCPDNCYLDCYFYKIGECNGFAIEYCNLRLEYSTDKDIEQL